MSESRPAREHINPYILSTLAALGVLAAGCHSTGKSDYPSSAMSGQYNAGEYYYETAFLPNEGSVDTGRITNATGASVELTQAHPKLARTDLHSSMQLIVVGPNGHGRMGVGWTAGATGPNMGGAAHASDYNGQDRFLVERLDDNNNSLCDPKDRNCGLVLVSKPPIKPGSVIKSSGAATYAIEHNQGEWDVYYNGSEVGYWPDKTSDIGAKTVAFASAYGEVATLSAQPCSEMGNGLSATDPNAARISNFRLYGPDGTLSPAQKLVQEPDSVDSIYYDSKLWSNGTVMTVGGVGASGC